MKIGRKGLSILSLFGKNNLLHFVLILKIVFWRNKMQFIELKNALKDFTLFSLNDIKRVDRH